MKKKLFLLAVLVCFCITCLAWSVICVKSGFNATKILKTPDIDQAYKNVLSTAVCIAQEGVYGSGNIYDVTEKEIIVVTAGHVLSGCEQECKVTFFDGKEKTGSVIYIDETVDIGFAAVLKTEFTQEESHRYCKIKRDAAGYKKAKKNDCFFMINMINDAEYPRYYEGGIVKKDKILQEFSVPMLYGDGNAIAGMSGCGLFDERGNYIAMLVGSTPQAEVAAIGFETIEEAYQNLR